MQTAAIGIDLGGTKIAAALVTGEGEVLAARHSPTLAQDGEQAVLGRIADLANELIDEASNLRTHSLLGLGIGSPGRVDPVTGVVHNAVNLGWDKVALAEGVRSRLARPLPVWIGKDSNTSTIGEYIFGAAQNNPEYLFLSIGTGLGGGLMSAGQLVTGANWNATELGHISLDPLHGRQCVCGLRGCAETIVSGPGLAALYKQMGGADLEPAIILDSARAGEDLALRAMQKMGLTLGIVIAFCVAVTNPSLVVIGGGFGLAAFDLLLPSALRELEMRVLKASYADLRILPSRQSSSAVGAASLAWFYTQKEVMPKEQ